MIPYHVYKFLHLIGIFLVLMSLGGQILTRASIRLADPSWKKHLSAAHGFGLILVFVAGFGLLAQLGLSWPWPGWVFLKILVWLILGALPITLKRFSDFPRVIWWVTLCMAALAAYLANFKPLFWS